MNQESAPEQEPEETLESELETLETLREEKRVLTTWVVGLLEGCEGCTDEAISWVRANEVIHEEAVERIDLAWNRRGAVGD